MIRRPVAVDPVKATMSTSGEVLSTSPTRWSDDGDDVDHAGRDVGLLGDQATDPGGVPRACRAPA